MLTDTVLRPTEAEKWLVLEKYNTGHNPVLAKECAAAREERCIKELSLWHDLSLTVQDTTNDGIVECLIDWVYSCRRRKDRILAIGRMVGLSVAALESLKDRIEGKLAWTRHRADLKSVLTEMFGCDLGCQSVYSGNFVEILRDFFNTPLPIQRQLVYRSLCGSFVAIEGHLYADLASQVLRSEGIPHEQGEFCIPGVDRKVDLAIPNQAQPVIAIECSFANGAGSGQSDKRRSMEEVRKAGYISVALIDGFGWLRLRSKDAKGIIAFSDDVFTFHSDQLRNRFPDYVRFALKNGETSFPLR